MIIHHHKSGVNMVGKIFFEVIAMDDREWQQERERLNRVLSEARKQFNENCETNEKYEAEAIATQRDLWEDIGSISASGGLNQLVDFLEYIQTMKIQKRSYRFVETLKVKYAKMLLSPYFGRVDFREMQDAEAKQYYIGTFSLINDEYEILIYDWRAPVSSLFYDFEIGEAEYECPKGMIAGAISLKRQYKIANGNIEYLFDSNLKIDDEMLQQMLSKNADSKMKAIVTTIQREQNKAIRKEQYKNLIVQGTAGSGKTSIALHRVAYLLYKYRDKITSKNILIFSPNAVFNDYISNVLPELGEENMLQTTFEEYMHSALAVSLKKESYYDMVEYILAFRDRPAYQERIRDIQFKSSLAFRDALKKFAEYMKTESRNFCDIVFQDKLIISSEEMQRLFEAESSSLPLSGKLEKIRARVLYLLTAREEERAKEVMSELGDAGDFFDRMDLKKESRRIVRNETKDIRAAIDQLTQFDLVGVYKKLFERLPLFMAADTCKEIDEIRRYTLENIDAGQLYYEDQIPLLYLQGALGGTLKTSEIKFVIIDEAQDYTPLQYEIFHQLFQHANITMLGDLDQSIAPFMNLGSYANISHIFSQDSTLMLNLTKSYRSTVEITMFARKLLSKAVSAEAVERHGAEPIVVGFPDEEAIRGRILHDIKAYSEKGFQSIGVITRTRKEADEAYQALKGEVPLKAILSGEDGYVPSAVILPAYLAKGLEFDVVILYNAGGGNYHNEDERLLFYTACTRALHVLCVYYSGQITPLLAEHLSCICE